MIRRRSMPSHAESPPEAIASEADRLTQARHDPVVFNRLLTDERDAVFSFCYHRLASFDDAEDATQETLVRAARGFDRFTERGSGSFHAWVITIAKNEVIDEIRRRK